MTSRTLQVTVVTVAALWMALPALCREYLYEPRPLASGEVVSTEGILVREVEVRKGDTMYDLSRTFTGRGMYYPQILLFNAVKNPNLIYPGDVLKIPVSGKNARSNTGAPVKANVPTPLAQPESTELPVKAGAVTTLPADAPPPAGVRSTAINSSDATENRVEKNRTSRRKKTASAGKSGSASPQQAGMIKTDAIANQQLFEGALKAYRKDDCRTALELFARYLADNSNSPLAADAQLYMAECYMKMSAP